MNSGLTIRCKKSKGFTLIEVLVAVALSAILLGALYGTFFTVFNSGKSAEDSLDKHIEAGRLLDRITMDVHAAFYTANSPRTMFTGGQKGLSSILSFTAFVNPPVRKGYPTDDLIGVSYFSEEGEDGVRIFREVWNPYIGEKVKVEMLDGAGGFDISYYNGTDWVKAWDAVLEKGLPAAVKVTLRFKNGEKIGALARTMLKARS